METLQNGVIPIPDVDTMEVCQNFSSGFFLNMLDRHSDKRN